MLERNNFQLAVAAVLASLAVAFLGFAADQEAFAFSVTIGNEASCESAPISGTWNSGQCTITDLTINRLDSVTVASGVELVVTGTLDNLGTFTNHGTITNSLSIIAMDNNSILTNHGTITNSGGLIHNNDSTFINSGGTIHNINLGTINSDGPLTNSFGGTIDNSGGTINIVGGTLTNNGILINDRIIDGGNINIKDGRLNDDGPIDGGTLTNNGTIINNNGGTININSGGTLDNTGGSGLINTGIIDNIAGHIDIDAGATISNINPGHIDIDAGATIDNDGLLSNHGTIDNDGLLSNHGTIDNDGLLSNDGTIDNDIDGTINSNGTIDNDSAATITNAGTLTLNNTLTNAGTLANSGIIEFDCGGIISGTNPGGIRLDVCEPVAISQSKSTNEDTSVAITITAFNPEVAGNPFKNVLLGLAVQEPPKHGWVTVHGAIQTLTYTPNLNFFGSDSFTFSVFDGRNWSPAATVSLTVIAVNDPPIALPQFVTAGEGVAVNILLAGSDVENDVLTFSVVTPPSRGTLSGTAPDLTYTPNDGFVGSDFFTFKANDGQADSNNFAIVGITVVDNAPPTVTGTADRASDSNGWYNHDVTITWSGSDSGSGIASCDPPTAYSGPDGSSITLTGKCTDQRGNVGTGSITIKYDETAPVITGQATTLPNENDWYSSDVTVHFTASDATSGIQSVTPDVELASDGVDQSATGTATDNAGNTASFTVSGIDIDKTAPTITASPDRPANTNGWYNADVTFTFACDDGLSGVESCSEPETLSDEGAGQSASGSAMDAAGNEATIEIDANIDKTAPEVTFTQTPEPNANGWNNQDVTVHFEATDSVSGIDGESSLEVSFELEGEGQTTGLVIFTDLAGNSASEEATDINIDKTAPEVTGAAAESPNENGWYNEDVEIEFEATDSLSGIDGSDTATETISEEGESQSASHTFTDLAGNSAEGTVDGINLDKTAPELEVPDDIEGVLPTSPDGSEVDFEAEASDNLDPSPEIEYSDEPGSIFAIGTTTVEVTATDQAGNSITDSFTITVLEPEEAIEEVVEMIEDMDLPGGTENGFTSKLDAAIKSLEKGNEKPAQNQLEAFINHVEAQTGKSITEEQAEMLIAAVQDIINSIS